MKVDLLSVTDEPVPFKFRLQPDEIDLDSEAVRIRGAIDVVGELGKNAAKTDIKGSISAPLEIDCTRCLVSVEHDLNITFHVDFVDREMFPESKETHLENSDLDTDVIEGNELDLAAVAREQILLELPVQVLCKEDCKGICPTCGKDLNEGECGCCGDEIDPRWAVLKDLK
ncbi:MAG TPA: DUF177 domain-containing protein [Pyrinomonadaceae bacterium]|jgi:uncharacterized protein